MNHSKIITTGLPEPTQTLLLNGADVAAKREEILAYFNQTWDLYESLFDCLSDERAYFNKAISLRHPLIFYFGHTATFYINKLMAAGLISQRIDDGIEAMLAIGVDEMSWDDLDNSHYSWPSVAQLRDYRGKVRTVLVDFIENMPLELPLGWESPAWVILMGIEHERIHLETSSVLMRQLPVEWVKPQAHWPACPHVREARAAAPLNSLISMPGGPVTLGKTDDTYGWDNEYGTSQPHSQSKCNKVTHWPDSDKITVLALLEIPLHAGKTSHSERAVLHRKTAG